MKNKFLQKILTKSRKAHQSADPLSMRAGWTADETTNNTPLTCYSVGWLVKDGEDAKVLSAHITQEESPQRCGDMTIPSRAILCIREIPIQ